jgi:recombination protein RecA
MMHSDGISYEGDILDLAMIHKLITRSGTWFRYGDEQLGQGRERVRDYLKEHPQMVAELREKILAASGHVEEKPEAPVAEEMVE